MRVHELAKELEMSSKELLDRLHGMNVDAKSSMKALTDDQVQIIRSALGKPPPAPPAPMVEPAAAATAETGVPSADAAAGEPMAVEPAPSGKKIIAIKGHVVLKEFAVMLGVKPNQLIAELMGMNVFASINEKLDFKVAAQLGERHGVVVEHEKKVVEHKPPPKVEESKPVAESDRTEDITVRPPIVTFLGHVDHGKTSLLDRIRDTKVAAGEDGGITQHIGAYSVKYRGHTITFLDTPGHEAFTAMRARGANLTDIAVLVVAADDGLMPQTKEAIQHAKAANVPMIAAINKIDLRAANVDRVKRQLQQIGLTPEDWGGELICCPVSATTGEGIDHLLEMILLQSEMLELKANPKRKANGFVIEARLEAGMGPTANLLVRNGTLHVGDAIVCGPCWGRIKALINDQGIKVRTAGPSTPVKCLGLTDAPSPGTEFLTYLNDRAAKALAEERVATLRTEKISAPKRTMTLEELLKPAAGAGKQELAVLLKTDVQGSLEAIQQAMGGIKSDKVALRIVLAGVGNITGNDVLLASASKAVILGFHVAKEDGVTSIAKREGVEIRLYSIIYEMLDEIRDIMAGLLEPIVKEHVHGHAEIRQLFEMGKKGMVAGCMCIDGRVTLRGRARVKRGGEVIYEGHMASLRRFQNEAAEVREGQECGIRLDNFHAYQAGDVIESYEVEKIAQQL